MPHRPALAPVFDRRHRWKVLGVGVAANACFSAAINGLPTAAVLVRSGYQLDNAALGLVLGLMGLGVALGELPWGLLTDRWGDRPVLLLGLGSTAAALAAMALWGSPSAGHVPGLALLACGLLLVGLLGGSVNGSSGRAVMTWFGPEERGLAMSIRQTAIPLGGGLGALVLPALALHQGFAAVYALLATACVVTAMLTWRWLHEPAGPVATAAVADAGSPAPGPLRDRQIWRLVLAIGILCAPQFAILSFGTVFLHDVLHAGTAVTTAAMVALQTGAMVMRIASGRWTDRHGHRRGYLRACTGLSVLLFAVLAAAALYAGRAVPHTALTVAVAVWLALAGTCVSAWHGVAYAELATLAGARRVGTALGMANTAVFVVCFATPLAIGQGLPLAGWGGVWLGAACCALAALPLFALARGQRQAKLRNTSSNCAT
ncbi:MFS transporter [Xylophilus sp. GW821-FHT01B05]